MLPSPYLLVQDSDSNGPPTPSREEKQPFPLALGSFLLFFPLNAEFPFASLKLWHLLTLVGLPVSENNVNIFVFLHVQGFLSNLG